MLKEEYGGIEFCACDKALARDMKDGGRNYLKAWNPQKKFLKRLAMGGTVAAATSHGSSDDDRYLDWLPIHERILAEVI
jgi:hypothetical protein